MKSSPNYSSKKSISISMQHLTTPRPALSEIKRPPVVSWPRLGQKGLGAGKERMLKIKALAPCAPPAPASGAGCARRTEGGDGGGQAEPPWVLGDTDCLPLELPPSWLCYLAPKLRKPTQIQRADARGMQEVVLPSVLTQRVAGASACANGAGAAWVPSSPPASCQKWGRGG